MADDASHLTIGEVLALVRDEFPDITISKIRFLESQGLIDPQRSPSGYRKFYDDDVAALRWVLRQQRDNFLPLKVIKAKLSEGVDVTDPHGVQQNLWGDGSPQTTEDDAVDEPAERAGGTEPHALSSTTPEDTTGGPQDAPATRPDPQGDDGGGSEAPQEPDPGEWLGRLQEAPESVRHREHPHTPTPPPPAGTLRFGRDEILAVTTVTGDQLDQMIEYRLVEPVAVGGETFFDATAVAVVRAVAAFADRGLEARHLRIFKNGAEREAGLVEQMVLPLLKQRNPKAREQALDQLVELRTASDELHRALTDQALRARLRLRPCRAATRVETMIEVELSGVRVEMPSNTPLVVLRELDAPHRELSIFIGAPEATAIAFALEDVETPRPLTHDLFVTVLAELGAELVRVDVTDLSDSTFFAELHLEIDGTVHIVSSRPSDAVALAVRTATPMFVAEAVMDEAAQIVAPPEEPPIDNPDEVVAEFRQFIDSVDPEDFAS